MMILPSELIARRKRSEDRSEQSHGLLKRSLDIILASLGILILLPFVAIAGALIVIDNPGPIFYAQERIGVNRRRSRNGGPPVGAERRRAGGFGRPFTIYKLRSMVVDAERNTGPIWAAAKDSRVTRVGRLLRKTRFDETPQLWNVLRGDMSLVGPRPERAVFVHSLVESLPEYPMRYKALPGITGLAQVKSRYDSSIETVNRKLQYDLYYVRHGRLLLDLKIMAATLKVVARGEGAH
ncbi:MAG TPA: sugar transferase [Candidatus Eisenbacteria bacterium]|nr:sugar transferase [Candidatus Eisenbacteria bacterium]